MSKSLPLDAPRRLTSLDALRGVAALAVVIWHWQHFFALGGSWQTGWRRDMQPFFAVLKPLYVQGWAAVDLFFVLSGFVFFWLYGEAIRGRTIAGGRFGRLRLSRLYPLQLATLLLVAALQFLFFRQHGTFFIYRDNDAPHFLAQLFLMQSWWPGVQQSFDGPSWSVSIEAALYIVFFVTVWLGLKAGWQAAFVALAAVPLLWLDEHLARGGIGFFMGGAMVGLWQVLRRQPRARLFAAALLLFALAGWAVLVALLYGDSALLAGAETNDGFLLVFDFGLCPLTVLALALWETERGRSYRHIGFLGDISYSTYLLHFPLQLTLALLAARLGLGAMVFMQGWAMIAFYALLIALGAISYRFFERPLQDLLRGKRPALAAA